MLNITLLGPFYILGGDYTPRPISGSTHSKESSSRGPTVRREKAHSYPRSSGSHLPSGIQGIQAEFLLQMGHPRVEWKLPGEWATQQLQDCSCQGGLG